MHKFMKRALTLALAGVMTFGLGVGALADTSKNAESNFTITDGAADSDTAEIYLVKNYSLHGPEGSDNTSKFHLKITPYGVWNAGTVDGKPSSTPYKVTSISDHNLPMPYFGNNNTKTYSSSVSAIAGSSDVEKIQVTLPTYYSVGDFWYMVQETSTNVSTSTNSSTNAMGLKNTGVLYGTNSQVNTSDEVNYIGTGGNGFSGTYYMHVQVVNNDQYKAESDEAGKKNKFNRSVTLHTSAPESTCNNTAYNSWKDSHTKVQGIENKYYAGSLKIEKKVAGNAGDKDKRFEVTVVFTKPADTIINSVIKYKAYTTINSDTLEEKELHGQDSESSTWMGASQIVKSDKTNLDALTNTVKIYIKDGETVEFQNIPYGVTYTVKESEPAGDKYTNTIAFQNIENHESWAGKSWAADTVSTENSFDKTASGSIVNATDHVLITNQKTSNIDVGVILDNAPYVAMLVIAAAAMAIFVLRHKTRIEE